MNSFLNRVLAPGLRRVGSGLAYPRKAEPASGVPSKGEPVIEEIVEEQPVEPSRLRSGDDAAERDSPEVGLSHEGPSLTQLGELARTARSERPSVPETRSFLKEKFSFRPAASDVPPIAGERSKTGAESFSFEAVELNPSVHPSMRRFQSSGEKLTADEASARSKSETAPDQPSRREIVWEVIPTDRRTSSPKERVPQELPSETQQSQTRSSDPVQPAPSADRSPQRTEKGERAFDLSPKAPIPTRGAPFPDPPQNRKRRRAT